MAPDTKQSEQRPRLLGTEDSVTSSTMTPYDGYNKFDSAVGFDCSSPILENCEDWNNYVIRSQRHFESSVNQTYVSKDTFDEANPAFRAYPIRDNGMERVVLKLQRSNESVSTKGGAKEVCTLFANSIKTIDNGHGVSRDEVKQLKIVAAWQGLTYVLLEAPSSVWSILFFELVRAGGVAVSKHVFVDTMAPAFVVRGPFPQEMVPDHFLDFADAVVREERNVTLLVPTRPAAHHHLASEGGMEYWHSETAAGWKTMPSIATEILGNSNDYRNLTVVIPAGAVSSPETRSPESTPEQRPGRRKRVSFNKTTGVKIFGGARLPREDVERRQRSSFSSQPEHVGNDEGISSRTVNEIEVRMWFSLRDDFPQEYLGLFRTPVEDRLSQPPDEINAWLQEVELAYEEVQKHESERTKSPPLDEDYNPVTKEIEVLTWYSLQDKFQTLKEELFQLPASELLQMPPAYVVAWLKRVQATWDENQKQRAATPIEVGCLGHLGGINTNDMSLRISGVVRDDNSSARAASAVVDEDANDRLALEREVRRWYEIQKEVKVMDDLLFRLGPEELLRRSPMELETWLMRVRHEWDKHNINDAQLREMLDSDDGSTHASSSRSSMRSKKSRRSFGSRSKTCSSISSESRKHKKVGIDLGCSGRMHQSIDPSTPLAPAANNDSERPGIDLGCSGRLHQSIDPTTPLVPSGDINDGSDVGTDGSHHSIEKEMEVRYWFEVQGEFKTMDEHLFKLGPEERLKQEPSQLDLWLKQVQNEWDTHQNEATRRRSGLGGDDHFDSDGDHEDDEAEEEIDYTTAHVVEVKTWFSLQDEFNALDQGLFQISEEERLRQPPTEIQVWLKRVQAAWNRYQHGGEQESNAADSSSSGSGSSRELSTGEDSAKSSSNEETNNEDSGALQGEVRKWYAVKDRFPPRIERALFGMSMQERMRRDPIEMRDWLRKVKRAWNRR